MVQVFNRLGWPLKIFGDGPELESLKKKAKRNISLVGRVSDEEKARLLRHARAFIHPQIEDLGITPIESMASGRPVIAYGVGGVTETVIPGKTGAFFYEQSWEALLDTLLEFDHTAWNGEEIRQWAEKFAKERFKDQVQKYVSERYADFLQELQRCQLDVRI